MTFSFLRMWRGLEGLVLRVAPAGIAVAARADEVHDLQPGIALLRFGEFLADGVRGGLRPEVDDLARRHVRRAGEGIDLVHGVIGDGVAADLEGAEVEAAAVLAAGDLGGGGAERAAVEEVLDGAAIEVGGVEPALEDLAAALIPADGGGLVGEFGGRLEGEPARAHGSDAGELAAREGAVGPHGRAVEGLGDLLAVGRALRGGRAGDEVPARVDDVGEFLPERVPARAALIEGRDVLQRLFGAGLLGCRRLAHPRVWRRLRLPPSGWPAAAREMVRWKS